MSETPRIYSTSGAGFTLVRRRRSQRVRRSIIAVCGVALVYSFWISRDTHPIAEFVEADRALEVVIPRANGARHRLAESRLWNGVPQSWVAGWPSAMADTRGLPEWIVGNLVGSGAIAVADDVTGWTDLVVASKMIYANHYFRSALELRLLIPDPARGPGFWFVTVVSSRTDGMTGFTGIFVRRKVRSEAREGTTMVLINTKKKLEKG